jgi:Holliday junction resolvasome RuvABC endonuclease subunit
MRNLPPRTLAVDMASRLMGWAVNVEGSPRPAHDTVILGGIKHLGRLYSELENTLDWLIDKYRPGRLIWCMAIFDQQQTSGRALNGLQAVAELTAYNHQIEPREAHEMKVRAAVLGRSSFGTRDEFNRLNQDGSERAKEAVMAWCKEFGYAPRDHNAGDALVLLEYDRMSRAGELDKDGRRKGARKSGRKKHGLFA